MIAWLVNIAKDTLTPMTEIRFEDDIDPMPVIELYEKRKRRPSPSTSPTSSSYRPACWGRTPA
jgi:hypothetical protein